MFIVEDKKIILLHNPKTGGLCLYPEIHNDNIIKVYKENKLNFKIEWCAHLTYKMVYHIYGDKYQYYTFVRNPYDRCISALNYLPDEHDWYKHYTNFELKKYDNNFNLCELLKNQNTVLNIQHDKWWYPHFLYQSEYADKNVNILKYESIEDWNTLKYILDIPDFEVKIKPSYNLSTIEKNAIDSIYREKDSEIYKLYNL